MHLPNVNFKIIELLHKKLLGTLSENEEHIISEWLSNEGNKELFEAIKKEILEGNHRLQFDSIDVEKGWARNEKLLSTSFRRRAIYKFTRIAAAVMLILSVGSILFYVANNKSIDKKVIAETQIIPGEQKAELVLGDGSVIALAEEEKKIEDHGVQILTSEGMVDYKSDNVSVNTLAMNTLKVPVGGEYQLKLSDGTKVWLNSVSQLKYPITFSGKERKVYLKGGEAYFEVKHDPEHPFIISTDKGMEVEVLGTSFSMMAYDDESSMLTTLVDGSVRVNISNGKSVTLEPGEQAQFQKSEMNIEVKDVNTDLYTAWVRGRFVFEQEELESILRKLSRWYDVEIFYQNESVRRKRLSADLRKYDDISSFLNLFMQVSNIEFEVNGKTILVKEIIEE